SACPRPSRCIRSTRSPTRRRTTAPPCRPRARTEPAATDPAPARGAPAVRGRSVPAHVEHRHALVHLPHEDLGAAGPGGDAAAAARGHACGVAGDERPLAL